MNTVKSDSKRERSDPTLRFLGAVRSRPRALLQLAGLDSGSHGCRHVIGSVGRTVHVNEATMPIADGADVRTRTAELGIVTEGKGDSLGARQLSSALTADALLGELLDARDLSSPDGPREQARLVKELHAIVERARTRVERVGARKGLAPESRADAMVVYTSGDTAWLVRDGGGRALLFRGDSLDVLTDGADFDVESEDLDTVQVSAVTLRSGDVLVLGTHSAMEALGDDILQRHVALLRDGDFDLAECLRALIDVADAAGARCASLLAVRAP